MKKLLFSLVSTISLLSANAQDSTTAETATSTPLVISGSVDSYYRTVIGAAPQQAPASSFANGNGMSIGMANIIFKKEGEKTGFVADLVFGPRGNDAVFGSTIGSTPIVNQLYAYWNVSDAITFTLGNFNTFLGYELISPTGNFNYSTSYMFSYGPFSHTGLKADILLTDELSVMIGVMNVTDATETNPINNMTLGTQVGYTNDNGGVWLNFIIGNQGSDDGNPLYQIDLTTGWDLTDALYLGLNTTAQVQTNTQADASGFAGAAAYIQYALFDSFKLGVRGEHFMISNGYLNNPIDDFYVTGLNKNNNGAVTALTLSGNYVIGDLTLIPEFRADLASKQFVGAGSRDIGIWTTTSGKDTAILPSFLLAAVYAF